MKKIIFLIGFGFSVIVKAQPMINLEFFDDNRLQWGYYFGLNTIDFKFDYQNFDYSGAISPHQIDVQVKKSVGFNVGLSGDIRLIKYLNLRFEPGLIYNQRKLHFAGFTNARDQVREVNSTYIYFPLLLKYSTKRWYNIKPYITAGASAAINLSANHKISTDNSEMKFRMKQHSFFYEIGFGIDFYTAHFRFSPSIRGLFSMRNELIPDKDPNSGWTGNLNGIYTRGIMLNLTFE